MCDDQEETKAFIEFVHPCAKSIVIRLCADSSNLEFTVRREIFNEVDAVVNASRLPEGGSREFVTTFGLTQPGAQVALKVYVILTTGNEAGSAPMIVQRSANVSLLVA